MNQKRDNLKLNAIALLVAATGFLTLQHTMFALAEHRHIRTVIADTHFTVLAGISLIYLSMVLRRGKRNAQLVAIAAYLLLIPRNFRHFVFDTHDLDHNIAQVFIHLGLPIVTLIALLYYWNLFNVKSEIHNFATALRRSALILLIAFMYGFIGFQLFDTKDFHQEISFVKAAHYTVDQLGLSTNNQPTPYSRGSYLFKDSLAAVTLASVFYVTVSFFAPIRFRLRHGHQDEEAMKGLTQKYSTTSEDFFKLWPKDKDYFFSRKTEGGLSYKSRRGVALVVGDPLCSKGSLDLVVNNFEEYCRVNDWRPAFIHVEDKWLPVYEKLGYEIQKIGEEAVINTKSFCEEVAGSKYFRQINNRFEKLSYECEMLSPPHSQELVARLKRVSDEWLEIPGRSERGFLMGYFSEPYMQQCDIMVAKDAEGQIRAFLNQIPKVIEGEANYDFLRACKTTPGNINDYLMLNFIKHLNSHGILKLNMGLSPLTGLDKSESEYYNLVDSLLNFVYENAGRFYSFQGLARFKSKYQPEWQSRYVAYTGGLRGFTKVMNVLLKSMNL